MITVHRPILTHIRGITVDADHLNYQARAVNGRNGSKGWNLFFKGVQFGFAENVRMIEFVVAKHAALN